MQPRNSSLFRLNTPLSNIGYRQTEITIKRIKKVNLQHIQYTKTWSASIESVVNTHTPKTLTSFVIVQTMYSPCHSFSQQQVTATLPHDLKKKKSDIRKKWATQSETEQNTIPSNTQLKIQTHTKQTHTGSTFRSSMEAARTHFEASGSPHLSTTLATPPPPCLLRASVTINHEKKLSFGLNNKN
jgi:hypothetical protein